MFSKYNDISFSIKKGEIVCYIGPNGAGKSTTIKILSGILVPDSGKVKIKNMTPKDFGEYAGIAQQYIFHYSRMHPELFE